MREIAPLPMHRGRRGRGQKKRIMCRIYNQCPAQTAIMAIRL